MSDRFRDRREAGRVLAKLLDNYAGQDDVVVVALPRGGVPVGYEVAIATQSPLDVCLVRKLGAPHQPELALGAIASGGVRVLNEQLIRDLDVSTWTIDSLASQEESELNRRESLYRSGAKRIDLRGKTCIMVDDGLATGASMLAAIAATRAMQPHDIVVAVPVASAQTCADMAAYVEEVVCVRTPAVLAGVGMWYDDFDQTSDDEVRDLLAKANTATPSHGVRTA